jgi:hypothetical protein
MSNSVTGLLTLDERKRASLSRFVKSDTDTYAVTVDEDGTITLTPGRFVPEYERRLHEEHPELAARLRENIARGADQPLVRNRRH